MIINIFFTSLLIFLSLRACYLLLKKTNNKPLSLLLIVMTILHFLMFLYHWQLDSNMNVDSKVFFDVSFLSENWSELFGFGNKSIPFLIYPLTKIGLNFFSCSLLFSVFSYIGYLVYFKIITRRILEKTILEKLIISIFLLMPSLHFWTGSLNKEAIIFLLMAVIFKKVYSRKLNSKLLVISILLILFIRPYLAAILLFPIIALNYKKLSITYKWIIGIITIVAIPLVLKFLRLKNFESLKANYLELALFAQNNGGSSIDLLNSHYLERVFLVMFRPLFFDAKTQMQYFVSIENVLGLVLFIGAIYLLNNLPKLIKNITFNFLIIYTITIISFYGIYMYNLGLASRMRVLFVPYALIVLLILINYRNKIEHY